MNFLGCMCIMNENLNYGFCLLNEKAKFSTSLWFSMDSFFRDFPFFLTVLNWRESSGINGLLYYYFFPSKFSCCSVYSVFCIFYSFCPLRISRCFFPSVKGSLVTKEKK